MDTYEGTWQLYEDPNKNYSLALDVNGENSIYQIDINNYGSIQIRFFLGHIDSGKVLVFKKGDTF